MASTHPNALLAPALAHHGITLSAQEVAWTADLRPAQNSVAQNSVT
jgi:hypothetical protein